MYYSHEIFFVTFTTLCKDLLFYYFIQFSTALEIGILYWLYYVPTLLTIPSYRMWIFRHFAARNLFSQLEVARNACWLPLLAVLNAIWELRGFVRRNNIQLNIWRMIATICSVFSTQRQRHLYFSLQYLEKLYGTSLVVFIVGITEEKWEQACVKLDTYKRPSLLKKAAYVLCIVHGTAILLVSFFEKTLGSRSTPSTIFYYIFKGACTFWRDLLVCFSDIFLFLWLMLLDTHFWY